MSRQKQAKSQNISIPSTPQYMNVAEKIIRKIQNGAYSPGEKLKGMRMLAKEHNVSFQVIISAIQELTRQNYVISRPKSGVFVNPQKLGRFSRFGIFINQYNPCAQGKLIGHLYHEANKLGYDLLQGTDYDGGPEISEWLASHPYIDGVFILGVLAEKDLAPLRKSALPYLVLGNHPISEVHPQLTIKVAEGICKALTPHLARHAGKRIAAMVGSKNSRPDQEVLEGVRQAIINTGGKVEEDLLLFSEAGGLKEVTLLLENKCPDVLYLHSLHREYARYCQEHPEIKRPVIVTTSTSDYLKPKLIDVMIKIPDNDVPYAAEAVKLLSAQVDGCRPTERSTVSKINPDSSNSIRSKKIKRKRSDK